MNIAFITRNERNKLITDARVNRQPIEWLDHGGRRYPIKDDTLYLVEGEDHLANQAPPIPFLTADQASTLITFIMKGTHS